jgi:hypothetical protein
LSIGKCPIALLPGKLSFYPFLFIDKIGGIAFDVSDKICN